MSNTIVTIFLQQILSNKLLLTIMNGQKNNLSFRFKLELIIIYHL